MVLADIQEFFVAKDDLPAQILQQNSWFEA